MYVFKKIMFLSKKYNLNILILFLKLLNMFLQKICQIKHKSLGSISSHRFRRIMKEERKKQSTSIKFKQVATTVKISSSIDNCILTLDDSLEQLNTESVVYNTGNMYNSLINYTYYTLINILYVQVQR